MPKRLAPAATEVATLLQEAAEHGRIVILSTADQPQKSLVTTCRLAFGLTHAEASAFVELVKRGYASKDELHLAISRDDPPVTGIKIVDVIIARVRRKVAPHEIRTVRGLGYQLAEEARDKILAKHGHGADITSMEQSRGAPP